MIRAFKVAGCLAGAALLAACGQSESNDADAADDPTTTAVADNEAADRLLVTDAVASWPTVEVADCKDYTPTHPRELVVVDGSPGGCLEAAIASDSAVFSGTFAEPLSDLTWVT